jgi:hypothetical protein
VRRTLDGEYDDSHADLTPFELFLDSLGRYLISLVDEICSKPPMSWLDRILTGPVGPSE